LVVHSSNGEEKLINEEKLGYFTLINRTLSLMTYQLTQMTLERYSPDILVDVSWYSCDMFDFYTAEKMVEIGRHAVVKSLAGYKQPQ
jgi:NTE family protein